MGIEKDYSSYKLKDVLAKYEWRVSPAYPVPVAKEKLEIADRKGLDEKLKAATEKFYKDFGKETFDSEKGDYVDRGSYEGRIFCTQEIVDFAVPLSFIIKKEYWRNKATGRIDEGGGDYKFALLRTDDTNPNLNDESIYVSSLILKDLGDSFDVYHRIVGRKFREQGFGQGMLDISSAFAQASANDSQKNRDLTCEVDQLDTVFWLLKGGFTPATPEDEEKLDKLLEGDENYAIGERYHIFPIDVPEQDRINIGTGTENMHKVAKCLRIKFKKEVSRNGNEVVEKVGDEVRKDLDEVLP